MGLDIYLYTAAQATQNAAHDKASADLYAEGPDGKTPRDRMSDEEYAAWSAKYSYTGYDRVPSEEFPDHLFERRYLRSSYNAGGFNHAVPTLIASAGMAPYPQASGSLYWIFEPMGREWDGDEGALTEADIPKLEASKARATQTVNDLADSDRLRVLTVSPNMFRELPKTTDDEALAKYRKKIAEMPADDDGWWSNIDMDVFGTGVTVLAAIPGMATFDVPGVHLIYRLRNDGFDSYAQSAKIVAEFCDEAIALIKRDGACTMSWSG